MTKQNISFKHFVDSVINMEVLCSSERSVNFTTGLHGVTSQKMVLFIATAVRICNPKYLVGAIKSLCPRIEN
jgi:hypothetical protein